FFFQAEDGIRYLYVTGVQTCALPISESGRAGIAIAQIENCQVCPLRGLPVRAYQSIVWQAALLASIFLLPGPARANAQVRRGGKIGRASCRERAGRWV